MIDTPQQYTELLKLDEVFNYTQRVLQYIKHKPVSNQSYLLDLEAKRLVYDLDEIDRAGFDLGDNSVPF